MSISYSSISSQVQAGATSVLFRAPDTIAAGDMILWGVANKYPTNAPGTPTGFTLTGRQVVGDSGAPGADVGDTYLSVYQKEAAGTEDGTTETISITSGNAATSRSVSYARTAGTGWDVAYAWGEQGTASNSWSITTTSLDIAAGDRLVVFVSQNADFDNTHTAHALVSSGVTFGSWTARHASTGTTQGDDCSLAIWDVAVNSGSRTGAMDFTMSLSGDGGTTAGGIMVVRLRETGAPPTPIDFSGTVPDFTGRVGSAFSQALSGYFTGSYAPFSYAVQSGSLPAGLSLNSSTGAITGTPTAGGTYSGVVVRGTDTSSAFDDTNPFRISIGNDPSTDVGYHVKSLGSNNQISHTTASHSFWHASSWWTLLKGAATWGLYKESGDIPASPGLTVNWATTPNLDAITSLGQCTVCVDSPNNKAYVLGYGLASNPQFNVLTYVAPDWILTQSVTLTGTAGVGMGASSTFNSNSKLSLGLDTNGVPMVFAGNKGTGASATNGCHIAWPDNPASLGGTWTTKTIDSASTTEADASGRFAGIFDQGGIYYIVVVYTDNSTDKVKLAYHQVETTLANYSTAWTVVDITAALSVDNHVWGGVMRYSSEQVVLSLVKDGDLAGAGYIYLMTSKLGAGLTWTHKSHRVTNGPTQAPGLYEPPSRPVAVIDESSGFVCILYHSDDSHPYGFVGYKTATMGDLLDAANENAVFDVSAGYSATPLINDESLNGAWNAKTPAHSVTPSMGGYAPVICEMAASNAAADSTWWNFIPIVERVGLAPPLTGVHSQQSFLTQMSRRFV